MSHTTSSEIISGAGGKEKRTRRRQRVSCVECTKRRQKCDRQYPCGLCVSRGVAQLCRWESGPVSRPAPARPPVMSAEPNAPELSATIKALSERLVSLEKTIADQNALIATIDSARKCSSPGSSSISYINAPSPDLTSRSSESEDEQEMAPSAPLQRDVHEAAITLAQLSLAHHGEYVGSGSVVCAVYKFGDPAMERIPYAKSTESTSAHQSTPHALSSNLVHTLAWSLPPRHQTDALLLAYFTDCNWRYGVYENWFRVAYSRMWRALDASDPAAEQINANWLALLFAVLALAPRDTTSITVGIDIISQEQCFLHAISARRLAEDANLGAPSFSTGQSAADGTVLGCVATVLIGAYLADRGRVSEAWKLVGGAIRAGQAAGMHRDPGWVKWEAMDEEERLLRSRGWWALVIWDRLFSHVLGRPAMIAAGTSDVPPPLVRRQGGSQDPYDAYQTEIIKLSEIVGEAGQKCISPQSPPYATVIEMDRRYEEWMTQLPAEFRWYSPPEPVASPIAERNLNRQRHTLAVWYLACRSGLHRPWITRTTPPVLPPPIGHLGLQHSVVLNPSLEQCVVLATELVRIQCDVLGGVGTGTIRDTPWPSEHMHFGRTFFVFDGAVTLLSALAYAPEHASAAQCIELVERAMEVLLEAGKAEGRGAVAQRALAVLGVLRRVGERAGSRGDREHNGSPQHQSRGHSHLASQSHGTASADPHPKLIARMETQLPRNPNLSIPFLAPSNLVSNPNPLGLVSAPTGATLRTVGTSITSLHFPSFNPTSVQPAFTSQTGEFTMLSNVGGGWDGMIWSSENGASNMDMHTLMPFDMLQGMPLGENRAGQ